MPDNTFNTTNGQPPMSLIGGGTNQIGSMSPGQGLPEMVQLNVPSAILQHPAVQKAVQIASQDMAQQASQMPVGTQPDDRTKQMIANMQAIKSSGILDNQQKPTMQGRLSNALMAMGQSLTGTPTYTTNQENQNRLQTQKMQQVSDMARYGQLTPEQQIMMGFRQQGMNNLQDQRQNQMEQQALARITSLRGDISLKNVETQRDAAVSAYNTLQTAQHEGRLPNQVEYLDILGQLWKARTGAAPTDQVLKEFNVGTVQQNLNRVYQWATGKPAPGNTKQVMSALKDFVGSTGESLDQQHQAYWKNHLIKPKGLDDDRWDNIKNVTHGNSFADATKQYADSLNSKQQNNTAQAPSQTNVGSGQPNNVDPGLLAEARRRGLIK